MIKRIVLSLLFALFSFGLFPQEDGYVLRLSLAEQNFTWDPQAIEHSDEYLLFSAVYQGLIRLDVNTLEPLPALAESWSISEDGLEYRFVLRSKLRFSDGTPITSQSFYRSFLRLIDPRYSNSNAELLYMVEGVKDYTLSQTADIREVGIEVVDARTIIFRLQYPADYFLETLAHPAFSPLSGSQLPLRWSDPRSIPFSGPYLYAGEIENGFVLRRNRLYWEADKTDLSTIEVHLFDDADSVNAALMNHQIDWAHNFFRLEHLSSENQRVILNERFSSLYYVFVAHEGPYSEGIIRQALAKLLPLQTFRDAGLPIATSLVPPIKGYPRVEGINSDYSEGMFLLEQAGYPEARGLPPITILAFSKEDVKVRLIKQAWQKAGIEVEVVQAESNDEHYSIGASDHITLMEYGWSGEYVDPLAFLFMWQSFSRNNITNFRSAEFDALVKESHFLEQEDRFKKLAESEAFLLSSGIVIPIIFFIDKDAFSCACYGLGNNLLGRQRFDRLTKRSKHYYDDVVI